MNLSLIICWLFVTIYICMDIVQLSFAPYIFRRIDFYADIIQLQHFYLCEYICVSFATNIFVFSNINIFMWMFKWVLQDIFLCFPAFFKRIFKWVLQQQTPKISSQSQACLPIVVASTSPMIIYYAFILNDHWYCLKTK